MQIGIIGAGKVGCSMGRYAAEHGIPIVGFYSESYEDATFAADFTRSEAYEDLTDLIMASDTLWIATPDDAIATVWDDIAGFDIRNYTIVHFSGSLSSDVFQGIHDKHAYACSLHPIFAFSDKNTSYQKMKDIYFTLEGDEKAKARMDEVLAAFGNPVVEIDPAQKARYHAAASMVSNDVLALIHTGLSELTACGFTREDAYHAFAPLIENNVKAGLEKGCVEALTGPIERNDVNTVDRHLDALEGLSQEIYLALGEALLDMAKEKHPDMEMRQMELRFR